MMRTLLRTFSWQEFRAHPWRHGAAVAAVMLGVALAFSVHLINASALSEFSSAVRAVNGQPDVELRAVQGGFDEQLYGQLARDGRVALASPVLEVPTLAVAADGTRKPLRVVGVDALVVGHVAPALVPQPEPNASRFAIFAPGTVFLNAAARASLLAGTGATTLRVQNGLALQAVQVAGSVSAGGPALAVMDIGAAQDMFARQGQLTRIDLRLREGEDSAAFMRSLALPPNVVAASPGDAAQRVSNLSRAYRVNLTVLALVALFTGAFLVFSVLSLSVAKRAQQFALLGVLGLAARARLRLVLWESVALGVAGSAAGIALGTALAALALRLLGGDLGGGYFAGVAPALHWSGAAALAYAALGVLAAAAGGWWPARAAKALPLAQTLKGVSSGLGTVHRRWSGAVLFAAGVLMATLPPLWGIPVAAYLSVGLLLLGGIAALPPLMALLHDALEPLATRSALAMLAVERARRVRESAAVAVSGVVAALALAVALTVMVASFRESVTRWLDVVLPADLYARTAVAAGVSDAVYFPETFMPSVARLHGVRRVRGQRVSSLLLDPARPAVALVARLLDEPGDGGSRGLPLLGAPLPVPAGHVAIYVSEPMVDLYGAAPGTVFTPMAGALARALPGAGPRGASSDGNTRFFVAGVWRDYARQFGAIAIDQRDFARLTGDTRVNDLALWLAPGADAARVQQQVRSAAGEAGGLIEFASAREIRAISLRIFDRSFAVTYWLQAVAIGIGLFGVAASFSAQVLARRKEFGLLAHLGLTRRQILAVVAGEGLAWTALGALAGLALGLCVSLVLVHVVNPQSFHWTMDWLAPWARLAMLCAAVVLAGTATAWLAGRAAASRDAVLAVKEDW